LLPEHVLQGFSVKSAAFYLYFVEFGGRLGPFYMGGETGRKRLRKVQAKEKYQGEATKL